MFVITVYKFLRDILHCYPFKITHVQELLSADIPARDIFPLKFLAEIKMDTEWPWKIFWTDEGRFQLKGYTNTQNCRKWATENLFTK